MSKAAWLRCFCVALAIVGASAGICPEVTSARAGDLEKLDTSLKLIPADAAFYSSMLRNREQIEMFLQSKAFAKLRALPAIQMGLKTLEMQAADPRSNVAQVRATLENPEVAKLVDLAGDMFSNEVFLYGDASCNDFAELLMEIQTASAFGPLMLKAQGQGAGLNEEQLKARAVLLALLENLDGVAVPNMLMGFKLDKPAAANEALAKLEAMLNAALPQVAPQLRDAFKREKIADRDYLVLRLNGEMIPWRGNEAAQLRRAGLDEEEAEKIIEHVKEMDLVIALGVRGNYLLASIGSSVECLEKLGAGDRLIDLPQLEPLAKFADRKLTGISYISGDMNQVLNSQGRALNQLYATLEQFLAHSDLDEEKTERILGDVQLFVEEIKGMIPDVAEELSFNFLSEQGIESYGYQRGNHPRLDGSKPLGLLEHAGGNPLFGYVSRARMDIGDYDKMVKWLSIGWKYFNEFAVPAMQENERKKFAAYIEDAMPLVQRLDKANRESLIPSMTDGQSALVLDGKFASKRIHSRWPEYEKAMPLPELGLVMSVSDAKLLKRGVSEYFAIAGELLEVIRKHEPSAIPAGFKLIPPQIAETAGYAIYSYPLPPEIGLDKNVVPNAGLSEDVAVLSLSVAHTERLLGKTPLAIGGVLAKADRPLVAAVWLNWPGLLEAASPWIDYGLGRTDLGPDRAAVVGQIHVVLDVLKCCRGVTVESYLEDDYLVTHSLLEIRDVEE